MRTLNVAGAALLLAATALPAVACGITVGTPGTLSLSVDGTVLASDLGAGLPATATVLLPLLSGATVEVASPVRVQTPADYDASAELLRVRYTASGLLSAPVTQAYTASTTSFPIESLLSALAISMTLHNRIDNPNGFAAGTYGTRTVITCHP